MALALAAVATLAPAGWPYPRVSPALGPHKGHRRCLGRLPPSPGRRSKTRNRARGAPQHHATPTADIMGREGGPMDGTLAGLCRFWLRSFLLLTARRRRGATTSHLASMHGRPCHVLCKFVYVHTNPSRRRMLCIGSGPRGAGLGEGLGRGPRAATTAKASQRHRPKRLGARQRRWRVPPVARDWPLARDI